VPPSACELSSPEVASNRTVADRCDGSTLFKVAEGTVWVHDFVKDTQVVLQAGDSYIARPDIARLK
jgi:hypothetical protein